MSIQEPQVSSTLQVEFDGTRLTAHYSMVNGEMELQSVTSNVSAVRVDLVTHLMLLDRMRSKCTG